MLTPIVIYEDENVLALNKPAGLLVHPAPPGVVDQLTLVDWLKKNYPQIEGVGEPLDFARGRDLLRPGTVHRLDKETSGVLVVAKNQKTFLHLKSQFQKREVKKVYLVLVYGAVKANKGMIDAPIGLGKDGRRAVGRLIVSTLRLAVTEFKVLERWPDYTFLEARPLTGRTHQLRVHFKSIGHPVVCDKLYAPRRPCLAELGRLALHAASLELTLPGGGRIKLEAGLPDDFQTALHKLRTG